MHDLKNLKCLLPNNNITTSKKLIKNTQNFFKIKHYSLSDRILKQKGIFFGWGRKKSGQKAITLAKKHHTDFRLLEDGFIRSIGLGVDGVPSFSIVEDDVGIYYDATAPSKLENILNVYDFDADNKLLEQAHEAMSLIREHHISKYNNAPDISDDFFNSDTKSKVLIIAQTQGDASLEYGMGNVFTTQQIIADALKENPNASVYIKIHPDVLSGKKSSDITKDEIPSECIIIQEDINPISLLKYFDKVYTKTSGMGMEALILGLDVVCYGMPYYAGWRLTQDKQMCDRRKRSLSLEALFAGTYILYTKYYNPYTNKPSDIMDIIKEIVNKRALGAL